jgi:alcohol dehydrogenase class IV
MPFQFYMPTRLVYGAGAIDQIGAVARSLGMKRPLVVSDPVIASQAFYARAHDNLVDAGLESARFEECGIDARVSHIDAQADRVRREGLDGIVCIGGGSAMCTGKGIAIVAPNGKGFRDCVGVGNFDKRALPMAMVPTTAGSGSEVSQFTIVKDEERHLKLVAGGPLSFPDVAILDPVTLDSLPMGPASFSAVDALTHALEAYFSALATPLTDAIALEAVRLQFGSMRRSICTSDVAARSDNLLASAMANIACGNARLGLAHALSLPMEGHLDLNHAIGVGVLMPRVLAFNAAVAPDRARQVARAFGLDVAGLTPGEVIAACAQALFDLYDDLSFPRAFSHGQLPHNRIREMAEKAVPGLYGMAATGPATDSTLIGAPAARKMTVRQAERLYADCLS